MDVSVVVPARNAAATLPETLRALAAQELDGGYEVILVDDGSTDATGALASAAGARVVRHEQARGSAAARNAGVAVASANVLAFTDADCAPAPGWLAAGLRALAGGADLVQGAVAPTPGIAIGPFDHTLSIARLSGRFETANLFVRADTFARAGGFKGFLHEERAGPDDAPGLRPSLAEGHFGEDLWFAYRALRGGARVAFSSEALVHHAVIRRDWRGYMGERRRLRYFPALTRVAPELREVYWHRVFLSRRSAAFELAALGAVAALAARRRSPLALALPYVALSARAAIPWRRAAPVAALGHVAGDAVGAVNLWRGSLAARTPVL